MNYTTGENKAIFNKRYVNNLNNLFKKRSLRHYKKHKHLPLN